MINTEMFKRIEETIIDNPEMHDQDFFEIFDDGVCGTTRCIAGWAIHLWGQDNGVVGDLHEAKDAYGRLHRHLPFYSDAYEVARDILGLSYSQANALFYNFDECDALRMVKEYARGNTVVGRL